MPRDSAGNTSFTSGVPVTGGTNISSAVFNALMADVYAMVQDSLSRSGKGGLLGPLKFADGSAAAPSIAFTEEGASGLHRAGANDHRYSIAGADVLKLLATGAYAAIFGPLTATSAVLKGAVADGASAVGTVLDNSIALASSSAKLVSVRTGGTEKAWVGVDGQHQTTGAPTRTALPTTAGWTDPGGVGGYLAPRYYKAGGRVYLEGAVVVTFGAGAATSPTLTMPAGYRPGATAVFRPTAAPEGPPSSTAAQSLRLVVGSGGSVYVDRSGTTPATETVVLDGISWVAG
jgi:hypothetical protein